MRQTIFDDEDLHSERSVLLERSITPRSFIQNEYAASEISCESKKGFDMCHIMEEEDSLAGDDQVRNYDLLRLLLFLSMITMTATTTALMAKTKILIAKKKMLLTQFLSQVKRLCLW